VVRVAKTRAQELGQEFIRVHCIGPGKTWDTPMIDNGPSPGDCHAHSKATREDAEKLRLGYVAVVCVERLPVLPWG